MNNIINFSNISTTKKITNSQKKILIDNYDYILSELDPNFISIDQIDQMTYNMAESFIKVIKDTKEFRKIQI